jgi:hypothetical protein
MVEWLEDSGSKELWQQDAVVQIGKEFGEDGKEFLYENANGNLAIKKNVLTEFRKLTHDTVVWERRSRYWRMRKPSDPAGRRRAE